MEKENRNAAVSSTTWEELEKEIYTLEEIAESDQRVAELSKTIHGEKDHVVE